MRSFTKRETEKVNEALVQLDLFIRMVDSLWFLKRFYPVKEGVRVAMLCRDILLRIANFISTD